MTDIATLGFAVDTAGLTQAGTALDSVTAKAAQTTDAVTKVGTAAAATGNAAAQGIGSIAPAANTAGDAVDDLSTRKLLTLQRSLLSLGAGIASGASPFSVMTMAGERAAIILGEGGGLTGVLGGLGAAFGALITPVTIAVGAIAGIGAAGLAGYTQWNSSLKDINASLAGVATATDITRDDIISAAAANTNAWGLSNKEAAQAATALAQIGVVSKSSLSEGVDDINKLSNALNISTSAAIDLVTKGLSGGIQGVEDLNKQYQFLSPSVEDAYNKQVAAGNQFGQSKVILDALGASLQNAANQGGSLGNAIGNIASDALRGTGALASGFETDQQKLDSLSASIKNYSQVIVDSAASDGVALPSLQELQQQYDKLKASIDAGRTSAQNSGLDALGSQALSLASKINPLSGEMTTLQGIVAKLNDAMKDPAIQASATSMQTLSDASTKAQGALAALNVEAAKGSSVFSDWLSKTEIGLDLQAVKLQNQIDLIGKGTLAQQQSTAELQIYDGFIQQLSAHSTASFTQMNQLWQELTTQTLGASDATGDLEAKFVALASTFNISAGDATTLWEKFHNGILQAEGDVNGLITNLNSATTAARNLASVSLANLDYGGGGSFIPGANNSAAAPSFAPSSFGFADGGSFIVPGAPSHKDNTLVQFHAASGERVSITPTRDVQNGIAGYADGGTLTVGGGAGLSAAAPPASLAAVAGPALSQLTAQSGAGISDNSLPSLAAAPSFTASSSAGGSGGTSTQSTSQNGGQVINISVNVSATDVNSFTRSGAQIASTMRRAVQAATYHR